jgi:hypothetical protein
MTDQEFETRLKHLAAACKKQAAGAYTTESDAAFAVYSIETLALLLIEEHEARHGKPTSPPR